MLGPLTLSCDLSHTSRPVGGDDNGGRMVGRTKLTDEDTVELQRLYSELPSAIAEAAEALQQQRSGQSSPEALREGDEKVDTIIKRICQLTEDPEAK
jgi:hypothetical protein